MPYKRMKTGFAALAFALLAGCGGDAPEDAIRAQIAAMEEAIEAKDTGEFVERVTEDFSGGDGQLDRMGLRRFLVAQMLGSERVSVTLGPLEVVMHPNERATVKVSALVTGGRFLPERGEALDITSGWRLDDGEWRCYTATWHR